MACRSGGGILLDLNNLDVSAKNFGFDAHAGLAELLAAATGQFQLAGHTEVDGCLIDTHGSLVRAEVWALYDAACQRDGMKPTLIEWTPTCHSGYSSTLSARYSSSSSRPGATAPRTW